MMLNRPPAMFVADAHALDFLNTIAKPTDTEVEWLASGEDLLAWLEEVELVPADVAASFRANALPGELDGAAAQARALREWFRTFVRAHMGKPLGAAALGKLAPLNRLLAQEESFAAIVAHSDRGRSRNTHLPALELRTCRRWRSPASLLSPVAQVMAEFVCTADLSMVRECEGPACTLLFLDTTHGHARRWCSMAACGNRAKQAAHRARLKQADA
jgi:predicted RNA-binding Zn ribbon-like protein